VLIFEFAWTTVGTNKGDESETGVNVATIGGGDIENATHEYSDGTDDSTRAMTVCLWQETRGCHHHHHHHHHHFETWHRGNRSKQNSKHYKVAFHSLHLLI
jgi:hypothetical protein